jgi:hypothetical protein
VEREINFPCIAVSLAEYNTSSLFVPRIRLQKYKKLQATLSRLLLLAIVDSFILKIKLIEMKKINLYLTLMAIFAIASAALIFNSCQKEEQLETQLQTIPLTSQVNNEKGKVIITISWDKWGLKKYDCENGAGLCNFKISFEYEETEKHTAAVYSDNKGNLFAKVFVDEELVKQFEKEDHSLHIEENLFSKASDGTIYTIPAGNYKLNPTMGKFGGYIIPLLIK